MNDTEIIIRIGTFWQCPIHINRICCCHIRITIGVVHQVQITIFIVFIASGNVIVYDILFQWIRINQCIRQKRYLIRINFYLTFIDVVLGVCRCNSRDMMIVLSYSIGIIAYSIDIFCICRTSDSECCSANFNIQIIDNYCTIYKHLRFNRITVQKTRINCHTVCTIQAIFQTYRKIVAGNFFAVIRKQHANWFTRKAICIHTIHVSCNAIFRSRLTVTVGIHL